MRIGVVSDTHGYFDPALNQALAGVELILHAGDVGSQAVLDQLRGIAPVRAVRGNVDSPDLELPLSFRLDSERLHVEVVHALSVAQSEIQAWARLAAKGGKAPRRSEAFLKGFEERTRVVIFGHSHQPCLIRLDRKLFFNPGSAGKRRFSLPRCYGVLELMPGGIQVSIELLEKYNGEVPPTLRIDFEG